MPDVQTPLTSLSGVQDVEHLLPAGANCHPVKTDFTTLMFGYFLFACWKPLWRSVSAGTPAMPRISTTLPRPLSFLNSHSAPIRPYATWSLVAL